MNSPLNESWRDPWGRLRGGWWAIATAALRRAGDDNISLIAAGVAFYAFTAIVPMLAAVVLSYGLVADAHSVAADIRSLATALPAEAASIVGDQLKRVVSTSQDSKGFGLVLALLIAVYGATKATAAMTIALNVAFRVDERRGFVMLRVVALAMVVGGVILVLSAIATTTVLTFLTTWLPWTPTVLVVAIRVGGYLLLALLAITGAAVLYRFAPNRQDARWRWLSPGAVLATLLWLGATGLFGVYVGNFGNYGATYGSLSAVIVLLTWLWLSAYVFLLGGELNAALEVAEDSDPPHAAPEAPTAPVQSPGLVRSAIGVAAALVLLKLTERRD
ncbi:YihY/virulence factor BrkB family protein [Sphingomonas oligophenolica]|uniref:YihY/virulence factor BrkB family protein n=1 Tax=Sphingomonas oligophenolica TaxID=301154 RepID=A0A502CS43_9SPHN|nr:YihY/virulence factor BrkB family protein [Sphingomonas oligophenolica]TPG15663.1 YihY/virulence factor BrkB family protein [Sphingomonas oligophenolica]